MSHTPDKIEPRVLIAQTILEMICETICHKILAPDLGLTRVAQPSGTEREWIRTRITPPRLVVGEREPVVLVVDCSDLSTI
jgi:hypothetical protein